jgi:hypothetical protein
MARSDKRYMVYPAPRAVEVVGDSAPLLNQAIECWGAVLARATADNASTFSKSHFQDVGEGKFDVHYVHEWGVLADVLKGIRIDPDFWDVGYLLSSAVQDAHRLGFQWLEPSLDFDGSKEVDPAIWRLVEKLKKLDYAHAWAVIVAVQWLWEHVDEGVDIKNDQWWTLAFRRQWKPKQRQKSKQRNSEKLPTRRIQLDE